jgi:hypothetical protein
MSRAKRIIIICGGGAIGIAIAYRADAFATFH